jgi:hypothetical protein
MRHLTTDELNAGVPDFETSPSDGGTLEMIVRRPEVDGREVVDTGELLVGEGLAGDNYVARGNLRTDDGRAHPEAQLTVMNSRSVDLVADGDRERWPLAGDQLFVDFDLSTRNAPAGTRLAIGTAVIEVSPKPHTGCAKFADRFGIDAARWVNSSDDLRLRGINAVVVEPGTVRTGDTIKKLD